MASIWERLGFRKKSDNTNAKILEDYRVYFEITIEGRESLGKIEGSAVISSESPKEAEKYLKTHIRENIEITIPWQTKATKIKKGEKRESKTD